MKFERNEKKPTVLKKHINLLGNVLIPIVVIILVISMIFQYGNSRESTLLEYGDFVVNQLTVDISEEVFRTVEYGKSCITNITTSVARVGIDRLLENPSEYIEPLIKDTPFGNIEYIRKDGMNIMNIGEPFDASDRVYYTEGIKGNTGVWNNYHPKMSKETLINFYTPLVVDGEIEGVITGYIEATTQLSVFLSRTFFNQVIHSIIYDENGMIVATSMEREYEPDQTLRDFFSKYGENGKVFEGLLDCFQDETGCVIKYEDDLGEGRFCVRSIPDTGWKLAVILPSSSFNATFGQDLSNSLRTMLCISFILLAYLVYVLVSKRNETKNIKIINTNLEQENQKYNDENRKAFAELKDVNEKLQKALIEQKMNLSIVGSLSLAYICIYYINLKTEQFIEISPTDIEDIKKHIGTAGNARSKYREMSKFLVAPEFEQEILEFTELSTLPERLSRTNTINFVFKGIPEVGWCVGEFVASGRDEAGNCTHVLWGVRSIQDQKNTEERKNRELMHQLNLVNTLSQDYLNVYIIRPAENVLQVLKLNGYVTDGISSEHKEYPYDVMCQRYIKDRVYSEDVEMMENVMSLGNVLEKLEREPQYVGTYRILDHDGIHYYQYKYVRIVGTDSIIAGFQNVDSMILQEKAQQEKLKEALSAAQNANKAKSSFLSNMSHDIRTPMNAIIGYSDMIRKEADRPEKVLEYQDKLHKSGELLLQILNNVLDMSRIESGKMVLETTCHHMGTLLKEIVDIFAPAIEEKHLAVTCENRLQHEHVMLDNVKTHELLTNLIGNAIKYTPDGGSITCTTQELPSDREGFALYETVIADTGIGMSEEFLPTIFDSFTRERNTTTGKVPGAGLGMSIVKALVDIMGGTIDVESKLGQGSRFTIRMYHEIVDESDSNERKTSAEIDESLFRGKRILLAEDNELNTEIATAILEENGFLIEHAEDGAICVDMLWRAEEGYYDLVLMDIQMPNLDGYSATKKIRHLSSRKKAEIPIIAMTANAFEEDRRNAREAGMNGHIAKPIDIKELKAVLADILTAR